MRSTIGCRASGAVCWCENARTCRRSRAWRSAISRSSSAALAPVGALVMEVGADGRILGMGRQPGALTLSEDDRRVLASWAADCAERTLSLFEAQAQFLGSAVRGRQWGQRARFASPPSHLNVLMERDGRHEHQAANKDLRPGHPGCQTAHQRTHDHTDDHAVDHADHAGDGEDELPAGRLLTGEQHSCNSERVGIFAARGAAANLTQRSW